MAKSSRKIPKIPITQADHVIVFVLFSFIIPTTNNVARIPNIKNNVIIVLVLKINVRRICALLYRRICQQLYHHQHFHTQKQCQVHALPCVQFQA